MKYNNQQCSAIIDVLRGIQKCKYILPAIQRKFVWSEEQIEQLFDSLMRGYPINTFMFWEINRKDMAEEIKKSSFYRFLDQYVERYAEDNIKIENLLSLDETFYAVIDGQQRLTALYLGLFGSYSSKVKYKKDVGDYKEDIFPKKYLYLDILSEADANNEDGVRYVFKFLTDGQYQQEKTRWFKVADIANWNNPADLMEWVLKSGIKSNFTVTALSTLREVIHGNGTGALSAFVIRETDIDTVLDIFLRTNSGGTKLSFSDLLMSVTINKWTRENARSDFKMLIDEVRGITKPYSFNIDNDLILKCCLMIFAKDVKSRVRNFDDQVIEKICNNWQNIHKSIVASFKLINNFWGINGFGLRATNAIVPIVYFVYKNQLWDEIAKSASRRDGIKEVRNSIRKWLAVSLLKSVFSTQTDGYFKDIRTVIDENAKKELYFPYSEIKDKFSTSNSKNLKFDEGTIEQVLEVEYGSPLSYSVLALLYPDAIASSYVGVAQDHVHPKTFFENIKKQPVYQHWSDEDKRFAEDKKNWNSILNLQLLDSRLNGSKNDKSLSEWLSDPNVQIDKRKQFIPETDTSGNQISYDIKDFKAFINARRILLIDAFKKIVEEEYAFGSNESETVGVGHCALTCSKNDRTTDETATLGVGHVIIEYTPKYTSFGWRGTLCMEISEDGSFSWKNGSNGIWNLSHEQEMEYCEFFSNPKNLIDFFDDNKAYNTPIDRINSVHPTSYTLKITWNGNEKKISVGHPDIPFKHPFNEFPSVTIISK